MSEAVFAGEMSCGVFIPDLREQWDIWRDAHEHKRVVVKVDLERQHRSLAQNRRYWSIVVPIAAEVLNQGRDIPLSKDQVHEVLKYAFIGHEDTPLGPVPKSSKVLTTEKYAEFCQEVEAWLVLTWGVVIPERGEDR